MLAIGVLSSYNLPTGFVNARQRNFMQNGILGIGFSLPGRDDFTFAHFNANLDQADAIEPDFVELPLFSLDVIAAGRVMPERLKRLKAMTSGRSYGYTVHAPLAINPMDEPSLIPMTKAVTRACLEVTAELGAVHIVIHPGIFGQHLAHMEEALYNQQRDMLFEFAEWAASLGVIIAVENVFPGTSEKRTALPSRLATEIAAIGHPNLRGCLDFSHAFLHANHVGADPMAEVAALAPYAKHLHIHDSFGRLNHKHMSHRAERLAFGEGDLHLPLGMGSLPWGEFMDKLVFPEGVILNLELAPPYRSELAASVAMLRELAGHVKTITRAA
jgi:sugar phosphate isomerase/epimerase